MKTNLFLIAIIPIFLSSCFAPVNLTYESAKTLDKGEIDIQGNYSRYYGSAFDNSGFFNYNNNYGVKLGYGIIERYTVKIRYERLVVNTNYDIDEVDLIETSDYLAVNYFELENKFKFKNSNIAIGIPFGYYSFRESNSENWSIFGFDPRVYFTLFDTSNKFELNIIPKGHFFFNKEGLAFMPGISIGFGFSSDLNKWALRPEFGYDGNLSFGIALSLNMSKIIKKQVE